MFSSKFSFKNDKSHHKHSVSSYYGDNVTETLSNWLNDDGCSDNTNDYIIFDHRKASTRSNAFNKSHNLEKPVHWAIGS